MAAGESCSKRMEPEHRRNAAAAKTHLPSQKRLARAHGVVVSHPLSTREALGPSCPFFFAPVSFAPLEAANGPPQPCNVAPALALRGHMV